MQMNPNNIPDHPWLSEFDEDPDKALDNLLQGVAEISPYERADASDVLIIFFNGIDNAHPLKKRLDQSIQNWLKARYKDTPEIRQSHGLNRYNYELSQAISSIYRLELSDTIDFLHENFKISINIKNG